LSASGSPGTPRGKRATGQLPGLVLFGLPDFLSARRLVKLINHAAFCYWDFECRLMNCFLRGEGNFVYFSPTNEKNLVAKTAQTGF